jgi:hypothetical protein
MLKYILFSIILIHGLIHLIGFSAGMGYAQPAAFTGKPIIPLVKSATQLLAIIWLVTTLLFIAGGIMFIANKHNWWIVTVIALIISQALIILYWHDAKAGTIANIIILIPVIISYANHNFYNRATIESKRILQQVHADKAILTIDKLAGLPACVQNWIIKSGAVDKEITQSVYLAQKGFMSIKPGSKYMPAVAEQYFNITNPSFVWTVKVDMMQGVQMTGRDKLENGHGNMLIKLYSLITFANGTGDAIDQGTMLRYLGEICWFPSAAVQPYISWEEINKNSARATMKLGKQTVSAVFTFDDDGKLIRTHAMRYMGMGKDARLLEWFIPCTEWKTFEGIRVPSKGNAIWKLKDGDFNYYQWEITGIQYNPVGIPKESTLL